MGELLAVAALLMFSANILVTNIAAKFMKLQLGFFISVLTNIVFAAVLFGGRLILSQENVGWSTPAFFLFVVGGFFSTYLGRYLFFQSIEKLGPAKASTFQLSNPLFTFLIAWFFLDEKITGLDILWMALMLAGLALTQQMRKAETNPSMRQKAYYVAGIALLSGLFYAIGNVLRGAAVDKWNEPILGALFGALVGAVCHLFVNPEARTLLRLKAKPVRKGVSLYILSGLLTISAQSCLMGSMYYIPVSIANLITLSTPVIVTPISYCLLKNEERLSWISMTGIGMALVGILMIVI